MGEKTVTVNPAMPTTNPETIKLAPFCNAYKEKMEVHCIVMYDHQK